MIEIRNLTKSFQGQRVLGPLDLKIPTGEITILAGPSGSGKSTLLKLINRLLEPDTGDIFMEGRSVRDHDPLTLRRSLGWVIQNTGLFPHMTVAENIAVVPGLLKWSKPQIKARVEFLLDLMGLPESFLKKYPSELSGGEAQRVGVARALGADPPVLLMDEPFGSLDPQTREILQDQFLDLQSRLKKTVILVTHEIEEALKLGDRIAVLHKGELQGFGPPEDFRRAQGKLGEFLGKDYPMRLLGRLHPHPGSPSAKDLLSRMIREGKTRLTLDSGRELGLEDILDLEKSP